MARDVSRDVTRDHDVLLGVYPSAEAADTVARRARDAGANGIHVGERGDVVAALENEMSEEMRKSWTSPQAFGVVPKEAAKGVVVGVPVAAAIGVLIALPLALIPLPGDLADLSIWWRLLIAAVVGAAAGGTVGFLVGAGFSAGGPADPLAAERGVTVRVDDGRSEIEHIMRAADPIRLDRMHPGGSNTVVVNEADEHHADDLANLKFNADRVKDPKTGEQREQDHWPPGQMRSRR